MRTESPMRQLWPDIHRSLREASEVLANSVGQPQSKLDLAYPPGAELSSAEAKALQDLPLSGIARKGRCICLPRASIPSLRPARRGCGSDCCQREVWSGVDLVPASEEDRPMLHDEFFESYWSSAQPRVGDGA